ncbi:exosortase B [Glaciimonas sp. Gout2]|uniref:exosortase B n=1 Tax=unclassified Glaciimonas TaxID=2644401 RepID=UPI002B221CF9|nr:MULTISPECIES: exosortase B [unclassified Glaciimonas]MEB0010050.1 exosortase B [Glaciimonas sp. Cout2]MEB0081835.1 exosortase B [Glaciimonas sp. Gout2]
MSTNLADHFAIQPAEWRGLLANWWPVLVGLSVLFVPTFYGLATGLWSSEEQAHGPLILALSIWLIYRQWPKMLKASGKKPTSKAGWPILLFGLLIYIIGRSQEIAILETGSFICILLASVLLLRGYSALKVQWFPFFFMLFMMPLPGTVVDVMTMPMKMAVSYVVEHVLYWMNYPIARSGVILQIGQYQLLVADACAGLHTLFALESLGLLYLNLVRNESLFRNISLAALIIPISFISNVIRVMVLTLITFYFGDGAGQGFLHGFAGMVLFTSALLLIMGIDSALQAVDKVRRRRSIHIAERAT